MIRALLLLVALPLLLGAQQVVDGVAAIVGDKVILKSAVLQLAQMNALQSGANLNTNPALLKRYRTAAFESLILQNILLARAKVDSLDEVADAEVDAALEQQVASILAQIGSEDRFKEFLGQSLREFKRDRWYDLRDQIIAERYQTEKIGSLTVTRDEVREFFHAYKDSLSPVESRMELAQIVLPIRSGEEARTRARQRIDDLRAQLLQGANFAELAGTYSDDDASQAQGGNLGFVRRGELVPAFEETAFQLVQGQVSDVVETVFGYHVIELLEKQGERINVRHILIAIEPTDVDREQALARIRDYYFILSDQPALFDSLVQALSSEENASQDLGYIGWFEDTQFPSEAYRSAVFGAQPGNITPPFQTADGFHILQVLSVKEGGAPTLEDYYPQIEAMALRNKQSQYLEKWLSRVRKDVFIKTLN